MSPPDPLAASRSPRLRIGVGAAVVLLIAGLGVAVLVTALSGNRPTVVTAPTHSDGVATSGEAVIFVHVLGEVNRPGLYELRDGARVIDVIAAAGGFTDAADRSQQNLARLVGDGEQLVVVAVGALPPPAAGSVAGLVNLNTADVATLETLPRIGPALAERIVAWREANGRFSSVEDLLAVSGIGERILDGLRDSVTV